MAATPRPPHPSDVAPYPSEKYQAAFMDWIVWHIWLWKDSYYNSVGTTAVDDATYDLWWANLLHMERKYPHLIVENTPTNAVGSPPPASAPKLTMQQIRQRMGAARQQQLEEANS